MIKPSGKLMLYALLTVILLFALVRIFIDGSFLFLRLELVGFAVLLVLCVIGFLQYRSKWGEASLGLFFLLYVSNLILIWVYIRKLYLILLILALAGFYLAVFQRRSLSTAASSEESHNQIFDTPTSSLRVAEETSQDQATASFIPGKFVASTQSNQFHEPKCEWAAKIRKERRLWFASKQEAWNKGYRTHGCVQ